MEVLRGVEGAMDFLEGQLVSPLELLPDESAEEKTIYEKDLAHFTKVDSSVQTCINCKYDSRNSPKSNEIDVCSRSLARTS